MSNINKEILIPFPSEKDGNFRDGAEIGNWMNGWERGFKEAQEELFNENDVRNVLKTIKILDPVHLEMIDSGHGEFPDTFKLTEQGIAKIIEQIKQSRL